VEVSFRAVNARADYRWSCHEQNPFAPVTARCFYWIGINLEIEKRVQAEKVMRKSERISAKSDSCAAIHRWSAVPTMRIYATDIALEYLGVTLGEGWAIVHATAVRDSSG